MKKLLLLTTIFFVTSCADNMYNSRGGVIKQHAFFRDYSQVVNQANSYCMALGMNKPNIKKIWTGGTRFGRDEKANSEEMKATKSDGSSVYSGEFDSYEFICETTQSVLPSPEKETISIRPAKEAISIDQAKQQCKELGRKPGTDKFGDCVLELTK